VRLVLRWADRRAAPRASPRRFLDFVVDGQPLSERHGDDLISCLGWFVPDEDERAARRLLGESPADVDGRVAIYVCPECGDVLCGALTARIRHSERVVTWSNFAMSWFDDMDNRWHHDPQDLGLGPELLFDPEAYRLIIERRHLI
jgi:hypothetical protein